MTEDLAGAVVVVTGGASGLGRAQVRRLVDIGARVVIADIDAEAGERLQAEAGGSATFVRLDVRDETEWAAVASAASAWGSRVHGLVNNAGIVAWGTLLDRTVQSFADELDVNLMGTYLGIRAIAPLMSSGGSVVNMSSSAGLRAQRGLGGYVASKWAVRGLTRTAALELSDAGIRVNCVLPGPVETSMLAQQTVEQREARRQQVPLRRTGTPEEIAEAVVFLLSGRSSFITGTDFLVDGGVTL